MPTIFLTSEMSGCKMDVLSFLAVGEVAVRGHAKHWHVTGEIKFLMFAVSKRWLSIEPPTMKLLFFSYQ